MRFRIGITRHLLLLLLLYVVAAVVTAAATMSASSYASFSSAEVYSLLSGLYRNGELVAVEKIAMQVIRENPAGVCSQIATSICIVSAKLTVVTVLCL